MSFLIKDDEVWEKYQKIWDVIKNKLNLTKNRHKIPTVQREPTERNRLPETFGH